MSVVVDMSVVLAWFFQEILTAYDAVYAELASRENASLATFDADLRRCAGAMGIKILDR